MQAVRMLLTVLSFAVALVVVAALAFVVVLVLAGPHASVLPRWLEPIVIAAGWIAVLALPLLVARKVWRRLGAKDAAVPR